MAQSQIRTNQGGAATGIAAPKHERIDKELLLLRNLPNQYKLGQKKTALGRVIYVSHFSKKRTVLFSDLCIGIIVGDHKVCTVSTNKHRNF